MTSKKCSKGLTFMECGMQLQCTTCNALCPFIKQHGDTRPNILTEKELKKDDGKLRYDLFPVEALEEITKVLNFGATKYADRSWETGMKWGRLYAALFRHMTAWWRGEDLDKETGITHLAHACCCGIFLLTYVKRGMCTFDDRVKFKKEGLSKTTKRCL